MEMLRRQFGIAEPVRRGMELKIAAGGEWRPAILGGGSSIHSDILSGRDTEIGWEDVFTGKFWFGFEEVRWRFWSGNLRTLLICVRNRRGVPQHSRLPHGDGGEDEDELVVID
jgi:hypothetical protein